MDTILGKTFQHERLSIDNKSFIRCTLIHCTLEYEGDPVSFYATRMIHCKYIFTGPAKRTVVFLQETGLMPYDPAEWGEAEDRAAGDHALGGSAE